ncbi:MAG TPA: hypothetical protein VH136_10435, partial [Trebonia sp.]|nr:hypothetical protein [Trebonia sp.]
RMIYAWERGDHEVSERYELLYRALGFAPDLSVCSDDLAQCEAAPVARSIVPRSRLETLSAGQLEELIGLLDDQWHALVRTDNLLGPRHALGGVRDQLGGDRHPAPQRPATGPAPGPGARREIRRISRVAA